MKFALPLIALGALATAAFAAPAQSGAKLVCQLTGKEMTQCCCEPQKDGKLLCKNTGKLLDECCCTPKETGKK